MSSEDKLLNKFRDNPKDQIAFQNLEESYFLEKKWVELAEIYQLRAHNLEIDNRGEASKLLFKLGEVYEKRLNLMEQAITHYEKALKLNPYSRNVHALIGLYKITQQWNPAATLLQNELKLEKDEYRQIQLHLELGEIYKEHIRKLSTAIEHYKSILKIEQYHRDAILSLQEIYQTQENWKSLQETLLLQLTLEKDPQSQIELYQHLAILARERFQDIPQAIHYYQKIIELNPAHLDVLHQLEGLYSSQNDYLNQVEVMNLRAKQTPEADLRTQLYLTIARIWEEALQNLQNATRALRKILVYDKNNFFVLDQLERLYRILEDWGNVTEMLERKLSLTHSLEERKIFSLELAELWANKLQNEDNAIHYYRSIIEIEPNNFDVLHLLQSLYHKRGYLAELLQTLQIEVEQTPSVADKIELYYQLGELAYQKLGQKETAIEAYLAILDAVPNDRQALEALKNVYLETEDWKALLQAYHRELKLCETPTEKIEILLKIGKLLADKLTQYEEASEYYQQILILNPKNLKAVQELKDLYRQLNDPANLLRMLQQELDLVSIPTQKIPLFMEIGQIQWTNFQQAPLAIATFRQVLEQDPFFLAAIQALKNIFFQEERWEDFIAIAKQEAELEKDHAAKIKVLLSIANVLKEKLSNAEESIVFYEKVEELDPGNEQSREQLKLLYLEAMRWETLIRFLLKETQYLTLPQQLYAQYREVALLYTNALKEPQKSIPYWEKNYSLIPSRDPLDALIPLYESSEQWEQLVSTYQRKLEVTPIPGEKIPLLLALGDTLRIRLDQLEESLKVYQRVIDIDPTHLSTLNLLETLLTQQSRWNPLVDIHQKQIEALQEIALKVEYHRKLSQVYETHLNKPKAAVKEFLAILELVPDSLETIEELLRLYRYLSFWHELVGILERKIVLLSELSEKISLLFEMGNLLQEKLRHSKKAVEKYEAILLLEEENPASSAVQKANTHLIELHQLLKEWPPLLKNYHLWLRYTEPLAEKIHICHKIAEVNRNELLDLESAEKILNEALKYDEFDLVTIRQLETIAQEKGEYEKQIDYLESQINLAETDEERKLLLFRVTEVYQQHLGDFTSAIFTLNRVLEINEKDLPTRQKLVQLYLLTERYQDAILLLQGQLSLLEKVEKQKNQAQIAWIFEQFLHQETDAISALETAIREEDPPAYLLEQLIHLYRKQQRHEEVFRIIEQYLCLPDLAPETNLSLLLEAGFLLDAFLDRPEQAESFYLKALEVDPGKLRSIKALEKIYQDRNEYTKLAEMYEKELKVIEEHNRSIFLRNQLGELYEKHLKQREKAIHFYHSVFSLDPKNLQAIRSLEKIYQDSHLYEKLCTLYEKEISITRDPLRKVELYEELGELYENQLSQRKRSILSYLQAHEHHPKNLLYLQKLADLYQKESDWVKLLEILEIAIQLAEKPEEQAAFFLRKGSIHFQEVQNEQAAEQTFLRLLEIEPKHSEAISFLKRIYEKKYPLKWAHIVQQEIENKPEDTELLDALLQIGKIYETNQKNEEAITYFSRVNLIDPGNKIALNELLKLYQKEEKWIPLLAIFELAAKLTKNAEEEMKLHFKRGEIYISRLLDPHKAILCFQKVLALQPNSISAIQNIAQLYRGLENWLKVIEYLLLEISVSPPESESIPPLYLEIATLYEQNLAHPANALDYYLHFLNRQFEIGPALTAAKKILAQFHRYLEWIELLKQEEKHTSDPTQKSILLYHIGKIYKSNLQKTAEAIPFYQKSVEQNPLNQKSWAALATSYESEYFYLEASIALEKVVSFEETQPATQETLLPLYLRLADLYRLKLGQFHLATPFYEKALAFQPQDENILHLLQELYRSLGQYKKLIELLLQELQQTTPLSRKIALLEETGFVWEYRLFVEDSAILTYEKLLEIEAENTTAIQALRRLYQNGEHFIKLIALHQKEILLAQNTEDMKAVIKLYFRIATIYARDLFDANSAIQTLKLLLEQDTNNQNALQFLQQLYQEGKDYESLVEAYKRELEMTVSETRQLFCFFEIARLSEEKRNRPAEAILYYRRVIQIDPAHLVSLRALRRLYRDQQAWDRLIEITEQEANFLEDLLLKAELHFSLGELWYEKFQNQENAIFHFQKAFEYNTGYLKAMQFLKQIYLEQLAWEKAIEVLEMEIKYSPEKQTKVDFWTQMGNIYENSLHQTDAALDRYEKALELNPNHLAAIIPLANIQYELKNWEPCVTLFQKYLQTELASEKKAQIAYQLADSYQHLNKMELALFHYQESFQLSPNYLPNLKALGASYLHLEKWSDALEIFLILCPLVTQENEYPTYLFQLAQIYEKLEQFPEAITTYKKALLLKPHSIPEMFRLVALYETQQAYSDIVPLLQNRLQEGMDSLAQDQAYLSLGKAQFYLRQPKEAILSLKQCTHSAKKESLEWIAKTYLQEKQYTEAIETLKTLLPHISSENSRQEKTEKSQYWLQIGNIYHEQLQLFSEASLAYREAQKWDPQSVYILEALGKTLEKQEHWDTLLQEFESFLRQLPESEKQKSLSLHLKLGQVYFEQLQNTSSSIPHYKEVLKLDPNHYAAHLALAKIQSGDQSSFHEAHQEHLYLLKKDPCLLDSYHTLGKIFSHQEKWDAYFGVCLILAFFKDLQKEELQFYNTQHAQIHLQLQYPLATESLETFLLGDLKNHILRKIIQLTHESLEKAYPPAFESLQLRKKDRLNLEESALLNKIIGELKSIFQLPEVHVYLTETTLTQPIIEGTLPPSLILSRQMINEFSLEELLFAIGRQFFFIADSQTLVSKLSEEEFDAYFSHLGGTDTLEEPKRETQKRVRGSISRKIKKDLEELLQQFHLQQKNISIREYRRKMFHAANACGFLFSNSLLHSARCLAKVEHRPSLSNLTTAQVVEQTRQWPEMLHLLRFGLSPEFYKLRQHLHLLASASS